ncbi:NAD(P)-binding protein [Delitschia confertaspora ATCC 74209]|uniref:NAD(P)-binding protein n=1 Tax=Delitschia confertaspora ATCC 74209 TaxID=1513339 RepID=A0A9P4JMW7_9PLEO|nr:NAD(P)-binding protein [Delitschia confertaspora ATCC 74209]
MSAYEPKSNEKVIIFGPTGAVGRAAAFAASNAGAKVYLAMRDPSKAIPGLNQNDEQTAGLTRLRADLTDPTSLKQAIAESGATRAYVYTIFNSIDSMRSSFDALKEAGVKFVVLLSSHSVKGYARDAVNHEEMNFIPHVHASAEIALEESGIEDFVAVRPAFFNSNIMWWKEGIKKGEVQLLWGGKGGNEGEKEREGEKVVMLDWIAPEDIGTVCGRLLAYPELRQSHKGKVMYLNGPKLLSLRQGLEIVAKIVNHPIHITSISAEDFINSSILPRPVAEAVVQGWKENSGPSVEGQEERGMYPKSEYGEAVGNLRRYLGKEPMQFEEWAQKNNYLFD